MGARYEIRETEPSDEARHWGVAMLYDVWDNALGRRVPFGRYRERELAQRRLERELAKEAR